MKPYISRGNKKMNIPTFSLPSRETCPGSTLTCRRLCYAKKSERYPSVVNSRFRNLKLSMRKDFPCLVEKVLSSRRNLDFFRIHESGDFYSQEYLDNWFKICKIFPDTVFLVFTQSYHLNFDDSPDNLVVYYSVWHDSEDVPDDGLFAYAGCVPIDCACRRLPYQCKKFCDDCMYCFEGKGDVYFEIH